MKIERRRCNEVVGILTLHVFDISSDMMAGNPGERYLWNI
jgi:hypothetical protein